MSDTKEEINCPSCNKKMIKIETNASVNVDICLDGCGGIWFDNRELEKFDEEHENADEIFQAFEGKNFIPEDTSKVRICPVCHTKMVKHEVSMNSDIEIDECYNCGGKFLDFGELNKIRNSKPTTQEQINDIVNSIYKENNSEHYVSTAKKRNDFVQKFIEYIQSKQ